MKSMKIKPVCYFCQRPINKHMEDFLCPGCNVYVCDRADSGCGHREGPWMIPGHRPEDHMVVCGCCGERECRKDEDGLGYDEADRLRYWDADYPPILYRPPTLHDVEKAIKIKAPEWAGRCFEIAQKVVASGIVIGTPRYGMYWGHISEKCARFCNRAFTHHGWIERPDRTIVDPTRWVFENWKPMIWSGWSRDYDVGGSRLYAADPLPEVTAREKEVKLRLSPGARAVVDQVLGKPKWITFRLIYWLAHRDPDILGPEAREIYQAIDEAGESVLIPIDFRTKVLGKEAL